MQLRWVVCHKVARLDRSGIVLPLINSIQFGDTPDINRRSIKDGYSSFELTLAHPCACLAFNLLLRPRVARYP